METQSRLMNFPISWFAVVMGLAGLTIAWRRAGELMGAPGFVGEVLLGLTGLVFVLIATLYGLKLLKHRQAVVMELNHPVKINFFPAISIGLILLSIATLPTSLALSKVLWVVGVALHLAFTVYVMSVWLNKTHFQIHHMSQAWFIPVVGNILIPIAGVRHFSPELSWFFFSIGLVFWLVLLTIVYYRVIFHEPLPDRLVPTLFILIAPPAVGFISYVALTGSVDSFARVLYYFGLFLTLLLFTQVGRFARLSFFLSWWAYSFPLAAITIATMLMAEYTGLTFFTGLAQGLLVLLTVLIAVLVSKTVAGIKRRTICVEE